ncbi:hypothetical protein MT355_10015 [Rathayibacter sp. VKM Ac-2929]|uniref:hypothetical protein n=1 Tax=Rathayibacter sp. VKM Ac-2929 TaxID=2929480 RepID=UPI001FB3416D|nr:hypothetical protein [Rathayibacter sp. VKM Ac-2929]MCJ1673589.1 hypothetical protein [Rathayibacter sp. VKM Ac-2929]
MPHRRRVASVAVVLAATASLTLSGCATEPVSEATVGIGRGGQRAEVLGVVVVCSGAVDGLDLAVEDTAPLLIGDRARRITRWVAPEPVDDIGATDLAGRTVWPADREIERFPLGVDLTLGAYSVDGSVIGRPVVFTAEQFDTLSVGEIIVGDIRDGTSETLSVENFLGLACQPR